MAIIDSQTAKGAQKGDFTRSFGGLPEVDGAETPAVVAKAAGVCPRKFVLYRREASVRLGPDAARETATTPDITCYLRSIGSVAWNAACRAWYCLKHLRLGPRHLVVARYRSAYRRLALLASPRPGMIYYRRSHRVLIIIAQIRGGHDGELGVGLLGSAGIILSTFCCCRSTRRAHPPRKRHYNHSARAGSMLIAIRIAYRNLSNARRPSGQSLFACPVRLQSLHQVSQRVRAAHLRFSMPPRRVDWYMARSQMISESVSRSVILSVIYSTSLRRSCFGPIKQ